MGFAVRLNFYRRKPGDPLVRIKASVDSVQVQVEQQDAKIRMLLAHYMTDGKVEAIPKDYLDRIVPALDDLSPRQYVAFHGLAGLESVLDQSFTVAHGMPL
jgi:hypothetical protein